MHVLSKPHISPINTKNNGAEHAGAEIDNRLLTSLLEIQIFAQKIK